MGGTVALCLSCYSNGQSVEGADHQYVVQCIRQSGKQVTLDIVPVSEEEARRLEPDNSAGSMWSVINPSSHTLC